MKIWYEAVKVGEIAIGLLLLYLRFCLYETEEGRLQNALVDLWVRVSALADSTLDRFDRLLRETARITILLLDKIFGPRLISVQAVVVSIDLAAASIALMLAAFEFLHRPAKQATYIVACLTGAITFAALTPALFPQSRIRFLALWTCAIAVGFVALGTAIKGIGNLDQTDIAMSSSLFLCALVDLLWLIVFKAGMKRVAGSGGLAARSMTLVALAFVAIGSFAFLPNWAIRTAISKWLIDEAGQTTFSHILIMLSAGRLFIAAIGLIQITVIAVAFVHWIIWPVLSRLVYAAERYNFFKERKLFGTVGAALLIHACAGNAWIKELLKTFGFIG